MERKKTDKAEYREEHNETVAKQNNKRGQEPKKKVVKDSREPIFYKAA